MEVLTCIKNLEELEESVKCYFNKRGIYLEDLFISSNNDVSTDISFVITDKNFIVQITYNEIKDYISINILDSYKYNVDNKIYDVVSRFNDKNKCSEVKASVLPDNEFYYIKYHKKINYPSGDISNIWNEVMTILEFINNNRNFFKLYEDN